MSETVSKDNLDDLKGLNEFCKALGLCLRCQLRYLGELYSSAAFLSTLDDVKTAINKRLNLTNQDESSFKRFKKDSYCFCCIGVLDDQCENNQINKVLDDKIAEFEYKFETFQINLSLPIIVTLRENIINAKILNQFRNLEDHLNECYTVKDVYRYCLIRRITKLTGARNTQDAKTVIDIDTVYDDSLTDCMQLYQNCRGQFNLDKNKKFEQTFNQTTIAKALKQLGLKGVKGLKLDRPSKCIEVSSIKITNQPLYIAGRYNKYSRQMSQTPWHINEKLKRTSLEEIVSKEIMKHLPCEKTKFISSGREDVDVRMLGKGRPFVMELSGPVTLDVDNGVFEKIREDVKLSSNNEVKLNDLQLIEKEELPKLKEGEQEKKKEYRALCVSSREITDEDIEKINAIKDLIIQQETPIRVLHRRTVATRPKMIHDLKLELIENERRKFYLNITSEAGTYIKEFVNSDFGRTSPSLSTLLGDCETDILELDVLEIHFDWPPELGI